MQMIVESVEYVAASTTATLATIVHESVVLNMLRAAFPS